MRLEKTKKMIDKNSDDFSIKESEKHQNYLDLLECILD